MKAYLTEKESFELVNVGFQLSSPCMRFSLADLLAELDVMFDGCHYELVRHCDGWEVSGDMGLTYNRCPSLIDAIAGTLYLWKKQKNARELCQDPRVDNSSYHIANRNGDRMHDEERCRIESQYW